MINSLWKRRLNLWLVLMSAVLVFTVAACNRSGTPSGAGSNNTGGSAAGDLPAEFRIGYQLTAGPETLVKGLGLMEEAFPDVPILWQSYDSGRDVNDAIAAGTIDAGLIGSVPVSTGIANGLPYQVYFILNILGDNEALVVSEATGISTTQDLPSKIIAVPFGSTTHFGLLSALEQDNINPEDVQIIDMQPQDMLAAWQFGEIDGGFVWQPTVSRMLDEGGNVLITARELADKGVITADLGVVSTAFATQYPDFLTRYVEALDTAVKLYQNEPETAAATMSEALALSPEESMVVMDELVWLNAEEQQSDKYMGTPAAPGALSQVLKDSAEFLVEQGELSAAPELDAYEAALFNQPINSLNK